MGLLNPQDTEEDADGAQPQDFRKSTVKKTQDIETNTETENQSLILPQQEPVSYIEREEFIKKAKEELKSGNYTRVRPKPDWDKT